tara:strand:+ start:58 stop:2826 length:2769 start_codon:yes stop_codon:yes gene_type:complete
MEAGSLFNQGYLGQGFNWWIGQIPDDSVWRDNINPGKFDNKQDLKGWGRRYKVRIIGLHDRGEETIPSQQLPWAQVMYPITAGGGQGEVYQTPGIRQGNFVFGFFMDGPEGQVPVIMGILGNNTQTVLEMTTSLGAEGGEKSQNFSPMSGFSETNTPKKETKEFAPSESLLAKRPIDSEIAKEEVTSGDVGKIGFQPTSNQQADIVSAREDLNNLNEEWASQGKSPGEIAELGANYVASVVKQGTKNRSKEANSPRANSVGNPTKENSDNPHLLTADDVGRDDKYREKIVLMKPDDLVDSAIKATQTAMDNLSVKADKFFKAQQDYGYIEAVSGKISRMDDLKKEMQNTSKEIAKYMKVPFNKMMEYTNKTLNKELTTKVSALPSTMRFQFADIKDITGETALESYGAMTAGLQSQIESIMDKMFDFDGLMNKINDRNNRALNDNDSIATSISGVLETKVAAAYVEFARRAPTRKELNAAIESNKDVDTLIQDISETNWEDEFLESPDWLDSIPITVPKVPICSAEDLLGRVLYANKGSIDRLNDSMLTQMNGFLTDIKSQINIKNENQNRLPDDSLPEGAILSQNDEEVLNLARGGADYVTSENVSTYFVRNINPGITTTPGRGATVNIGVSTGGLGKLPSGEATDFSFTNQGTGYTFPTANAVDCSIVGSGSGTGMKVNYTTNNSVEGKITQIFVHTAGTNYKPNTLMQIDDGDFNARFILDVVHGPINPGAIKIVNPGSKYKTGDILGIVGGNNLATFTVTSANDPGKLKTKDSTGNQLNDILGLIGNLSGNISAGLNFENMKTNLFPFELPPNPAVSDLYQFSRGGAGAPDPQMPNFGAVGNFVDKVESIAKEALDKADPNILLDKIPDPAPVLAFIKPSMGEPDLLFNGDNVDSIVDELRDTAGNLIDKNGNLLRKT